MIFWYNPEYFKQKTAIEFDIEFKYFMGLYKDYIKEPLSFLVNDTVV